MELQEAIKNRRSIKKYNYDMHIDEDKLLSLVNLATYAPNHGLREPWRLVYISKDKIKNFLEQISKIEFPRDESEQIRFIEKVEKVGGIFVILSKRDPRQKENLENQMAVGAFVQNLMLLIHEGNMDSCWKTPACIFKPKFREVVGVKDFENVNGLLYITEKTEVSKVPPRKNENLITKW